MDEQEVQVAPVEQEQATEIPAQAPESVTTALTDSGSTDVSPPAVEAVTAAPVQGISVPAFLTGPVGTRSESLFFSEEKSLFEGLNQATFNKLSSAQVSNVASVIKEVETVLPSAVMDGMDVEQTLGSPDGMNAVRELVSQSDLQKRTQSYSQLISNLLGEQNSTNEEIAYHIEQLKDMKASPVAIEKNFSEALIEGAKKDPELAFLYENNVTLVDNIVQDITEGTLVYDFLSQLEEKAKKDSDGIVDFTREVLSINAISRALGWGLDWADNITEMRTRLRAAKTPEEKYEILAASEEEIKQTLILGGLWENPDYTEEIFRLAFVGSESDRATAAAWDYFEFAAVGLGAASSAVRVAGGLSKAGSVGVKKIIGTATGAETIQAAQKSTANIKDMLSMKVPGDPVPSQYAKVNQEIQKQQMVLDEAVLRDASPVMRTEAEQFPVFDQGNIRSQFRADNDDVISEFVTAKGNPFATEATAKRRAIELGLDQDKVSVVKDPAGFVIQYRTALDEFGAPVQQPRKVWWGTANLDNVDSFIDMTLHQKGRLSEGAYAGYATAIRDVWKNGIDKMRTAEKQNLDRVMVVLRNRNTKEDGFNRWFSESEFADEYRTITKKEPSQQVITGYQTYKQLSDFAWRIDNGVEYKRLVDAGFDGYSVPFVDQQIAARTVTSVADDTVLYNTVDGSEVLAKDIDKSKFDIIEIDIRDRSGLIEAGALQPTAAKNFLVRKGQAKQSELDPVRIPYLAGGRVFYPENTMFLKQKTIVQTGQGAMRGRDRTLYRASSKAEAEDYAARWNLARREASPYVGAKNIPDDVRVRFSEFGLGTIDDFLSNAQANNWDLAEDMVAVGNRQRIPASADGVLDEFGDLDLLPEAIGNRFSKRGQGVPHVLGDAGENPLDPLAALSESVNISARNAAYSTYRQFSLETLKRKFGKYLDVPNNASLRAYLDAPVNDLAQKDGMISAVKAHQKYVQDVAGMRTIEERVFDRFLDNAAAWSFGKKFGPVSGNTIARNLEGMKKASLVSASRKLVFNMKMGLFNVATMPLQASMAPVVALTVPKYGLRSLANYPLFRMMLMGVSPTDPALGQYISKVAKGIDETLDVRFIGDLDDAVKEFRHMGINNFESNLIYVDAGIGSNRIGLYASKANNAVDKILEAGRKPFSEAELMPRIVSYMAARGRWMNDKKVNPKGLPPSSAAGRQWIYSATDKYVFGMTRADVQLGLRGNYAGAVAQFQSYVWRATSALVNPFNKTFTKAEKARMGLAYLFLYGTAAIPIPGSQYVLDQVVDTITDDPEERLALKDGVVNGVLSSWLGYEVDFNDRAMLPKYWSDMWDAVTGERSALELATGAAGQTGNRGLDGLYDIVRTFSYMNEPQAGAFTEQMAIAAAKNISSFNNVYKAWVAWDTGVVLSSTGRPLVNLTRAELVGQVFGFPSAKYSLIDQNYNDKEATKEVVDAYVKDTLRLYQLYAETDDPKLKKEYEDTIRIISNSAIERGINDRVAPTVLRTMGSETQYSRAFREMMERSMFETGTTNPEAVLRARKIQQYDEAEAKRRAERNNKQEQ